MENRNQKRKKKILEYYIKKGKREAARMKNRKGRKEREPREN